MLTNIRNPRSLMARIAMPLLALSAISVFGFDFPSEIPWLKMVLLSMLAIAIGLLVPQAFKRDANSVANLSAALGYLTGMSASAVGLDGRLSGPAGKMIAIAACVVCVLGFIVVAFVDGNEGKRSESKSVF